MLDKFTEKAKRVLFLARYEAIQMASKEIGTEHLLLGLLKENEDITQELFSRSRVSVDSLREELEQHVPAPAHEAISTSVDSPLSDEAKQALSCAEEEAERLFHPYVSTEHLLLGLLRLENSAAGRALHGKGMKLYAVREDTVNIIKRRAVPKKKRETPYLNEFSRDLTELARKDAFDPLIGRDTELARVVQVLSRRRKNNPVLLGDPGVGKTAIVEGLAARIVDGDVPPSLMDWRILALDLSLIVAGTKYRGQFEERLKGIIAELADSDDVIIFIDEIHSLIGAGSAEGSLDAANILKPALSRGEVQCIGATTLREYHKHIEKDRSLVRRFQSIKIAPPDEEEAVRILDGVKERYERFHQVRYDGEAIRASVYLSNRYITDRLLPDKAIDVIDEAGARVKLRERVSYQELRKTDREIKTAVDSMKHALTLKNFEEAVKYHDLEAELRRRKAEIRKRSEGEEQNILEVNRRDIEDVVSKWTGIPLTSVGEEERDKLLRMEDHLHERVIGQDASISALARAIRRSRAGLKNPMRPVGSFIFLGPTGVGKTEVARSLAEFLFGNEQALIRFDMSEYMEKHAIAKMIGSPPGYVGYEEGGQLTEMVKRRPYSVVLLDEIEKAHPDVLNILLQVLEDGRITDAYSEVVDFKNTIIIMTSNIGSELMRQGKRLGFQTSEREQVDLDRNEIVMREVKRRLSPEFLNRIDEIIVFDALTDEELLEISQLMIRRLNETLRDKGLQVSLTLEAHQWLVKSTCGDRSYGARPLRRGIQRYVEDGLSEHLLQGEFKGEGYIEVYLEGESLAFRERPQLEPAS